MVKQFMSRFTGILNLAEYGAALDGATDDLAAINRMIGSVGAQAVTLLVPGQCSVSANVTIPSNIKIRFEAGGAFVGAGTVTFTRWDNGADAAWTNIGGFANLWVAEARGAQYHKDDNGRVYLRGGVKNGAINTIGFVLPYHPSIVLAWSVLNYSGAGPGTQVLCGILIDAAGNVTIGNGANGNNFSVSLDGISFDTR